MNMRIHVKRGRRLALAALLGGAVAVAQNAPAHAAEWSGWKAVSTTGNATLYVSFQWNNNMNGHNVQFRCENFNSRPVYCHYTAEAKCINGSWVNLTGGENIYVRALSSANNQSWRGKCQNAGGVDYVSIGKFWVD